MLANKQQSEAKPAIEMLELSGKPLLRTSSNNASQRNSESKNVAPLATAIDLMTQRLTPRILAYEARLKKPFFVRGWQYLKSNYGEKGYKQTQAFLIEMTDQKISRTEDLIDLTTKYTSGYKLPCTLKATVLELCGFGVNHFTYVKDMLVGEILIKHRNHASIPLSTVKIQALNFIYQKIIQSNDYGESYLDHLNKAIRPKQRLA